MPILELPLNPFECDIEENEVFVQLQANGSLRRVLGRNRDEADWKFDNSSTKEKDTLAIVTNQKFDELCEAGRYKIACLLASGKSSEEAIKIVYQSF